MYDVRTKLDEEIQKKIVEKQKKKFKIVKEEPTSTQQTEENLVDIKYMQKPIVNPKKSKSMKSQALVKSLKKDIQRKIVEKQKKVKPEKDLVEQRNDQKLKKEIDIKKSVKKEIRDITGSKKRIKKKLKQEPLKNPPQSQANHLLKD